MAAKVNPSGGGIPKIIHRTLPPSSTDLIERCFLSVKRHCPSPEWAYRDYVSPRKSEDFPLTGKFWKHCKDVGQESDLVRLEVLYREGGIYLDSDVELIRPLDDLLELKVFAGYEDEDFLCNAVIGAERGLPEVLEAIKFLVRAIKRSKRGSPNGPKALTRAWKGKNDVSLFPPHVFYPYLYNEPERAQEDFMINPETRAVHHWAKQWKNDS